MFVLSSPAWADVKVYGAATVAFGLMKPHEAEIENLVDVEIPMLPRSSTRGLSDRVRGTADIAMLAEPLVAANTKQPEFVNPADYVGRHVGDASLCAASSFGFPVLRTHEPEGS
jgi:hypothetical protein